MKYTMQVAEHYSPGIDPRSGVVVYWCAVIKTKANKIIYKSKPYLNKAMAEHEGDEVLTGLEEV